MGSTTNKQSFSAGNDKLKMTILDAMEIRDLDDDSINGLIREYLTGLPETDEEKLAYINKLYKNAIKYLKEELFYGDQELGKKLREKEFSSWSEVIQFLKDTKKFKGKIKCIIAKYMLVINYSYKDFNIKVGELKTKTKRVVDRKLKTNLIDQEKNENGTIRGRVNVDGRDISFLLTINEKLDNSNVSKSVRNPDYHTLERISDLYRMTFEVPDKDNLLVLMQCISQYVFKKGIYEIKNKGLINPEDVESNKHISKDFKSRLMLSLKIEKRSGVNGGYEDIKLLTPISKGESVNKLSLEIKFTLEGNENETGLKMQAVFGYFKKISERIRTEGYIKEEYIKIVSQKFIENIKNLLDANVNRKDKDFIDYKKELFNDLKAGNFIDKNLCLENPHVISEIDAYLLKGLISYYKSKLEPVKLGGKGQTLYTNKRSIDISNLDFGKNVLRIIEEENREDLTYTR